MVSVPTMPVMRAQRWELCAENAENRTTLTDVEKRQMDSLTNKMKLSIHMLAILKKNKNIILSPYKYNIESVQEHNIESVQEH